jgi:hypothetical protein
MTQCLNQGLPDSTYNIYESREKIQDGLSKQTTPECYTQTEG